jgi:hypothetical protein
MLSFELCSRPPDYDVGSRQPARVGYVPTERHRQGAKHHTHPPSSEHAWLRRLTQASFTPSTLARAIPG